MFVAAHLEASGHPEAAMTPPTPPRIAWADGRLIVTPAPRRLTRLRAWCAWVWPSHLMIRVTITVIGWLVLGLMGAVVIVGLMGWGP